MTVIESRTSTTRNRNQQFPSTPGVESARSWTAACTVGDIDPFGRAAVMSRGLVGDRSGEPTVASPLLEQVFSPLEGRCLDVIDVSLGSFETKISGGVIFVRGAST